MTSFSKVGCSSPPVFTEITCTTGDGDGGGDGGGGEGGDGDGDGTVTGFGFIEAGGTDWYGITNSDPTHQWSDPDSDGFLEIILGATTHTMLKDSDGFLSIAEL